MKKKKADVIILAAGLSSRFPGFKPLFKLNNKTIIENIIDNLSGICYNIIVVCGYKANEMKTVLNKYGNVQTVVNKNYSDGMFSSIFVIPSDMPLVKKETYNTLLETEGDIIIPSYNGKKGHPVLMNSKFIPELLVKKSNSNFSDFIKKKGFNLVEVNDAGILIDIDTEEDLKNINSLNL